jgi:hypothetical protein
MGKLAPSFAIETEIFITLQLKIMNTLESFWGNQWNLS